MHNETLKQRAGWLCLVAMVLLSGAVAQAQNDAPPPDRPGDDGRPRKSHWIGLSVYPADGVLRSQLKLPEGQGLVVERIAPDGPGAKAGIKPNDILLKAGDKPLRQLPDLVDAIVAADGKPISLSLLRDGENKTVEVAPAERSEESEPLPGEFEVRRWIGRARELAPELADRISQDAGRAARDFVIMRPGPVLQAEFPKDLKVVIQKEGDQPAKVTVERGDKKWEVTDKTLKELPDEVRGYVEIYLGKPPTLPLPAELAAHVHLPPPPPPPGALHEDIERRLRHEARRLEDEAAPHLHDLQHRLEGLEKRLQERLRDVEKRLEDLTAPPKSADKT